MMKRKIKEFALDDLNEKKFEHSKMDNLVFTELNTPGTAGGPGGRDGTLAEKSRKNVRKITFFS